MSYSVTVSKMMKWIARMAGFGLLIKGSSFLKTSFLVGSHQIFFSGVNSAIPLVGAFGGTLEGVAVWVIRMLISGAAGATLLALTIPGMCASLYWSMDHWSVRLLLPIACFCAFVLHPVGADAYAYAFYWLIPVGLYCMPRTSVSLTALGSTFTAHAVGSVIWLYTMPSTAVMWLALIPIVALERLCFASGMVVMHHALQAATLFVKHGLRKLGFVRYRTAQ